MSTSVLLEAESVVHGPRQEDYGHPLDDMTCSAAIVTAVLRSKGKLVEGQSVEPEDMPLIMEAVKISRECNAPKRDNRVDGAGYWETLQMIYDERERQARVAEHIRGDTTDCERPGERVCLRCGAKL